MDNGIHKPTRIPLEIVLLPSPFATFVMREGQLYFYGPHSTVWRFSGRATVMFCTPNIVKNLLGHPRLFVNRSATERELPLLESFLDFDHEQWPLLLQDLRDAVTMTPDEAQFLTVWRDILDDRDMTTPQRQTERLCRRYAGQPPLHIQQEIRLSRQLLVDIRAGAYTPLGEFADQSHYIRECRKLTGHTPSYWQNLSATFYSFDGELVMIER